MSQYNTLLAERHFPLVGNTDRPYYHRVQHNQWPSYYNDSSPQLTVYDSDNNNTWQNSPQIDHFPQPTHPNPFPDYPESSQRTILTSSPPDEIESGLHHHPVYDHRRSHSSDYDRSSLWHANTPSVDDLQYPDLEMHAEDHPEEATQSTTESRQTSPPLSSVKVEPEDLDDCFIMELSSMSDPSFGLSVNGMNQALASPTEVPLRATQASKEMRKMMGVFRLNPFTMHTGEGRGVIMPAPWCGGGPLEEEPLIFEFQLDIEDSSGDRQFEYVGISSGPCTNSEEVQLLRSFSPSFELHPEDLRSEVGEEQEPDQQNEWEDADYGNQSEVDTSSSSTTTTRSVHTPSETRSQAVHTPFNESSVFQYPTPPPPVASTWDIDPHQPHGEEHLQPLVENMEGGHKMHRLHTTTSHPYLRRSLLNHRVSPSSSTHSLSHSRSELYPVVQRPTTHLHQHQHQEHYGNQVPSQSHTNSQSYCQLPTFHESMVVSSATPLELIPVSPQDSLSSSYSMRSGRTGLKLAQDETSSALHHHGIASEYMPRGTASSTYNTGQHEYETIVSSVGNHVFSPSRRWSLPETIGGPFRGAM